MSAPFNWNRNDNHRPEPRIDHGVELPQRRGLESRQRVVTGWYRGSRDLHLAAARGVDLLFGDQGAGLFLRRPELELLEVSKLVLQGYVQHEVDELLLRAGSGPRRGAADIPQPGR